MTETSDGVTVTNSATFCDFLGRAVTVVRPTGTDAIAYVGATSRKSGTVTTAGNVVRQTVPLYDAQGEEVGSFADGVTNRTDTVYETDEDWNTWKVTRTLQAAEGLTTVRETRERISGFASGVRSERVDIDANGVETTTVERYDAGDGLLHVTVTSPVAPAVERTSKYGLTVGERSGNVLVSKSYDAFGRCVDEKRSVGTGAAEPWKAYELNVLGDVVSAMTYTNATDTSEETFSYDAYGRVVSATDALGNETVTAYDANGQIVEVSGATTPVRYGYDAQGNRTALRTTKDGTTWDTTAWTVDPATGRTTGKTYPDGTHVATTYAPDGLPLRETRASGVWQQNAYDANRRLVGTSYSNPALNASFVTDAFGRTAAETNAACGIAYLRSNDGTATNETWLIGEQGLSVGRTFDAFWRRAGLVLSADDDVTIACSYDAEGRIASVTAPDATVAYSYAADGNETGATVTLGGVTIRREVVREAYRGEQVVAVSNYVGGTAVDVVAVGYDAANRVVSQNGSNVAYNVRSEMTEAFGNEYAYLQNGDFAGRTLATDVDGQVTTDGVRTFAYDAAGRLASVSSNGLVLATYAYDAQGRRVSKVTPTATSTYFYDGWLLVRELVTTTNGTERTDYVWGRDVSGTLDGAGGVGGLLYVKRGNSVCVPLYDNNGNVTAYVDGTGALVARYAYDGFGNVTAESGTRASEFRFRYSTKYADSESGLLYYGYRHYSPALRVWLTRDPLGENSGVNLHAFCGNHPLNAYDALGRTNLSWLQLQKKRMEWRLLASMAWPFFPVAADFLMHSISDSPVDPYVNGSGSRASNTVKASSRYRDAIMGFVRQVHGRWSADDYEHVTSVTFAWHYGWQLDMDLHLAINAADIQMKGEFCRGGGRIKIIKPLYVKLVDEYDYHQLADEMTRGVIRNGTIDGLNDLAYYAGRDGVLTYYTNWIMFRESRIGSGVWQ